MDIIVCIKPVLDPDLPQSKFSIDAARNRVVPPEGIPPVINPYDALAVEAALRIKEAKKEGRITLLTLGDKSIENTVRKALAMGADELVILSDPAFSGSDSFATAYILAQAVKKIGKFDLILCGRQAADWDMGVVGSALSEFLGIPIVTRAKAVQVEGAKIKAERAIGSGFETYEVDAPAIVTVSSEMGQPRIPSGWGIIKAAKKAIPVWDAAQLGSDPAKTGEGAVRNPLRKLYLPSYGRKCEMVKGEDLAGAVAVLAEKIANLI